jgi:hypothetical protein
LRITHSFLLASEPATILIHPQKALGPVNRLILGDNMLGYANGRNEYCNLGAGIWDPEKRCSVPEVVALAKGRGLSCSRWPGGCEAHRFEWKKTVGPIAERPNQKFGLPEFMQNCADIGAIAVITLGDFVISPEDAADMVEYLNSPNDGKNPNGGRDWAALRKLNYADHIMKSVGPQPPVHYRQQHRAKGIVRVERHSLLGERHRRHAHREPEHGLDLRRLERRLFRHRHVRDHRDRAKMADPVRMDGYAGTGKRSAVCYLRRARLKYR